MAKGRMRNFFKDIDIFGYPIGVRYKGNNTYKTWLGTLCTFSVWILILVNAVSLGKALIDTSRLEEKYSQGKIDRFHEEPYKLVENNLELQLVVWPPPPPNFGNLQVY